LVKGQKVRISLKADPKERKKRAFKKKGYGPQFSDEVFTISQHFVPHTQLGNHYWTVEGRTRKYSRSELEPIPEDTNNEVPKERPRFNPEFRGRTPKTRVSRTQRTTYRVEPIPEVRPKSTRIRKPNSQLQDYV
jgi:hypothetical protein